MEIEYFGVGDNYVNFIPRRAKRVLGIFTKQHLQVSKHHAGESQSVENTQNFIKINQKKCQKIKVFLIYQKNFTNNKTYAKIIIGDKNDKKRNLFNKNQRVLSS